MTHYYFYYTPKSYKILTLDRPVSQPILETLANDFQASLNRKVEARVPRTKEQIVKERQTIKTAQYGHKVFKKTEIWRQERDQLVRDLLATRTPNFGSIRLNVTRQGV